MTSTENGADRLLTAAENQEDPALRELVFMMWLQSNGYMAVRPLGDGRWAGLQDFMFTVAIVGGQIGNHATMDFRYCYKGETKSEAAQKALAALEAWDAREQPEPTGWHRDPTTGRKRVNGDPEKEYRDGEIAPWPDDDD